MSYRMFAELGCAPRFLGSDISEGNSYPTSHWVDSGNWVSDHQAREALYTGRGMEWLPVLFSSMWVHREHYGAGGGHLMIGENSLPQPWSPVFLCSQRVISGLKSGDLTKILKSAEWASFLQVCGGGSTGFGAMGARDPVPALPLTSWGTLGKSLKISEPQFSQLLLSIIAS